METTAMACEIENKVWDFINQVTLVISRNENDNRFPKVQI